MEYDPTTKTVVLFGGYTGSADFNETWTWDGVTWTQQFPTVSPSARAWNTNGIAFDSRIGKVVLFGGYSYSRGVLGFSDETWG